MNLAQRLAELEQSWRTAGMDRPVGLGPADPVDLERLESWLSPATLPGELVELYRWFGGSGDVLLPASTSARTPRLGLI